MMNHPEKNEGEAEMCLAWVQLSQPDEDLRARIMAAAVIVWEREVVTTELALRERVLSAAHAEWSRDIPQSEESWSTAFTWLACAAAAVIAMISITNYNFRSSLAHRPPTRLNADMLQIPFNPGLATYATSSRPLSLQDIINHLQQTNNLLQEIQENSI